MLFNIAESNAERVRKSFTATVNPHTLPGYKKSAILKPKSRRACFIYELSVIDNTCIICTVIHEEAETTEAIIKLCNYTPASIEVERGELFRNCSNYPYRTETNSRYLKKYDQIACIVHGAIAAGLLYDAEKPQEAPETITAEEAEQPTGNPEQATPEDVKTLLQLFRAFYNELYEKEEDPDPATRAAADAIGREYCQRFDEYSPSRPAILAAFTEARRDFITSDREAAAFMLALEALKEAQKGPKEGKTTEPTPTEETPEKGQKSPTTATPTPVEERPEPTPAAVEETTPESWTRPTDSGPDSIPTPVDALPIRQADSPGGRDGQTPTEAPRTARNTPTKVEPLQTTTRDGNGPKCANNPPYTPRPELSTIYTRGSPVKTINPMTTGQEGQL